MTASMTNTTGIPIRGAQASSGIRAWFQVHAQQPGVAPPRPRDRRHGPGLEHDRHPAAHRRRGHVHRPGVGDHEPRRADPLHVLVRPPAARLDPDRGLHLADRGVRALPVRRRGRPRGDGVLRRRLGRAALRPGPPPRHAPLGQRRRGPRLRAVAPGPAVPPHGLHRQRRDAVAPRRVRARAEPPSAARRLRRRRGVPRHRGAQQGDVPARAAVPDLDGRASGRPEHPSVHAERRRSGPGRHRWGVHPARRGQGRTRAHARQGQPARGHHLPARQPSGQRVRVHRRQPGERGRRAVVGARPGLHRARVRRGRRGALPAPRPPDRRDARLPARVHVPPERLPAGAVRDHARAVRRTARRLHGGAVGARRHRRHRLPGEEPGACRPPAGRSAPRGRSSPLPPSSSPCRSGGRSSAGS